MMSDETAPSGALAPTTPSPSPLTLGATIPEKASGAGATGEVPATSAPPPERPAPTDPPDRVAALEAELAALRAQGEAQARTQREAHMRAMLDRAKLMPDAVEFALSKLSAVDPFSAAAAAAVDAFAAAHPSLLKREDVRGPIEKTWFDGYKPDPNKPRLGDYIPRGAVPRTAGGSR